MKLKTFEEAYKWQTEQNSYDVNQGLATGIVNIDRVQFALGNVLWLAIGDGYYLDDYEESVTQYGITQEGKWAAVYGGHCSCYEWEEMGESDITYYDSLDILLKADKDAIIILQCWDKLIEVMPFLKHYLRRNSTLFREYKVKP